MGEEEVIRRCQEGDRCAYRFVVEGYEKVLLGTAYRMTRDRQLVKADTGESATTGKSGRYTIENVPEDNRTLTASKTGYVTQQKPATLVADQTTTVNFALALVPQ